MTSHSQVLATLVALAAVGSGCSTESDEDTASELAEESCDLVTQANSGLMAASGGMFRPESAPELDEVPGIAADAAGKASDAAELDDTWREFSAAMERSSGIIKAQSESLVAGLGSEQSPEPRIDKRTRTTVTESCSQFG